MEGDYRDVFSFGDILPALFDSHFVCTSAVEIFSTSRLVGWLSPICSDASFSFDVIAVTTDVTVDCVGVFLAGGISQVVLFERMSLARKPSALMCSSRHGSFGSVNELELSSPSNDFSDGDERNELLLLLDKIDDASKLRSKFKSSAQKKKWK